VCGSSERLEIHHRNGDWRDNRMENLETRCATHNPRGGNTAAGVVTTAVRDSVWLA
jgi:hypothetical protein